MIAPRILCITGNMASGKTTLTRLLGEHLPGTYAVPENFDDNAFLPLYMKAPSRWGFAAQLRYFYDYARDYAQAVHREPARLYMVDAGLWTNRLVYARYLAAEQIITSAEFDFYQTLCDLIQTALKVPGPDAYLFVSASPQTCWARMHNRGWDYQTSAVQIAYIEKLHGYFEEMQQTIAAQNIPFLTVSSEENDFRAESGAETTLRGIQSFLEGYHFLDP